MEQVVVCPGCQAKYRVPATAAGKKLRCKKCEAAITVPAARPQAAPPAKAAVPARPAAAVRTGQTSPAARKPAASTAAKPPPPRKPASPPAEPAIKLSMEAEDDLPADAGATSDIPVGLESAGPLAAPASPPVPQGSKPVSDALKQKGLLVALNLKDRFLACSPAGRITFLGIGFTLLGMLVAVFSPRIGMTFGMYEAFAGGLIACLAIIHTFVDCLKNDPLASMGLLSCRPAAIGYFMGKNSAVLKRRAAYIFRGILIVVLAAVPCGVAILIATMKGRVSPHPYVPW